MQTLRMDISLPKKVKKARLKNLLGRAFFGGDFAFSYKGLVRSKSALKTISP